MQHQLRFKHKFVTWNGRRLEPLMRDTPCLIRVTIRNISDVDFPGGTYEYVRVNWHNELLNLEVATSWSLESMPKIAASAKYVLDLGFNPSMYGPAFFGLKLKAADDGAPVRYYTEDSKDSSEEDRYFFSVKDRQE